uniref:Uncharacterized protein n=1 Tax=Brassica campestris TaxID=3711 RepID=M4DST4_BRACM
MMIKSCLILAAICSLALITACRTCEEGAFGDLIAKSGITADMLDSLIALKDFQRVDGLPPLSEIENILREKSLKNLQELRQNSRFNRRLPNGWNMEILWNQEKKM